MIEKPLENKQTFLVTKAQPNPESIIFISVSISTQRTKGHLPTFFIKNGLFPASFSLFLSFQYSWQWLFNIKCCRWMDLNREPLKRPLNQLSHNRCPSFLSFGCESCPNARCRCKRRLTKLVKTKRMSTKLCAELVKEGALLLTGDEVSILVDVLHELSLLLWNFINTTTYQLGR